MPRVAFTKNLQRHVACEPANVEGETVGAVLARCFEKYPNLRDYVVDEHGSLRKHMIVFLGGKPILDREKLTDPVSSNDEIYVFQALSGG